MFYLMLFIRYPNNCRYSISLELTWQGATFEVRYFTQNVSTLSTNVFSTNLIDKSLKKADLRAISSNNNKSHYFKIAFNLSRKDLIQNSSFSEIIFCTYIYMQKNHLIVSEIITTYLFFCLITKFCTAEAVH